MSVQDELAREEAAYLARRAKQKRGRMWLAIALFVVALALFVVGLLSLATSGWQFDTNTAITLGGGVAALVAGLDRLR